MSSNNVRNNQLLIILSTLVTAIPTTAVSINLSNVILIMGTSIVLITTISNFFCTVQKLAILQDHLQTLYHLRGALEKVIILSIKMMRIIIIIIPMKSSTMMPMCTLTTKMTT